MEVSFAWKVIELNGGFSGKPCLITGGGISCIYIYTYLYTHYTHVYIYIQYIHLPSFTMVQSWHISHLIWAGSLSVGPAEFLGRSRNPLSLERHGGFMGGSSKMWFTLWWTNIAMERSTIFNGKNWENPLFQWSFSIAFCMFTRG